MLRVEGVTSVVARRSWLEISLWKTKERQEEKKKSLQERKERKRSEQPSSTAEIR
jgi:hypothetical protein